MTTEANCPNCLKNTLWWSKSVVKQAMELDALMQIASRLTGKPQVELAKMILDELDSPPTKQQS